MFFGFNFDCRGRLSDLRFIVVRYRSINITTHSQLTHHDTKIVTAPFTQSHHEIPKILPSVARPKALLRNPATCVYPSSSKTVTLRSMPIIAIPEFIYTKNVHVRHVSIMFSASVFGGESHHHQIISITPNRQKNQKAAHRCLPRPNKTVPHIAK